MKEIKERNTDLVSLFESALSNLPEEKLEEIGIVVLVGDGVCKVHGLTNAMFGELIRFEGGNEGIVMQLDEDVVSIFLLHGISVVEREVAKRTNQYMSAENKVRYLEQQLAYKDQEVEFLKKIVSLSQEEEK